MGRPNFDKGKNMKHWMAVAIAGVMATGLSLANGPHGTAAVITPGLPKGWVADGLVAGQDRVGVDRPRNGAPAELVIVKQEDAPPDKPLVIYQTIDATSLRGHAIVFSFYSHLDLEPEVMRRTKGRKAVELHFACDGGEPRMKASLDAAWQTRRWVKQNWSMRVPKDATHCSFGAASLVKAELRLSRMRLKDRTAERQAMLAERPSDRFPENRAGTIFPEHVAAAVTPPNLEFKQ